MALPAGRKGVLPSELTPEGKIKNSASPYVLPIASAETLGGIKVGSGLSIADGVLSATGTVPTLTEYTTPMDTDRLDSCDVYCIDYGTYCIVSGYFGVKSSISDSGWRDIVTLPSAPAKNMFIAGLAGYILSGKQGCDMNLLTTSNGVLQAFLDSAHQGERFVFTFIYIKGGE